MARSEKRDPALVLDILIAASDATEFVQGLDWTQFSASRLHQAAVLRCIAVIGEAAGRLSSAFRSTTADIEWTSITGMRHRVIHDYDQVDFGVVWHVATTELPRLIAALRPLVPPEPQE